MSDDQTDDLLEGLSDKMSHRDRDLGPTLRDQFAMAALAGMLANNKWNHPPHEFAELAYQAADAMLQVREENT
jgi:hypothetical protein